jgi:outer membrane cobalamin receptor
MTILHPGFAIAPTLLIVLCSVGHAQQPADNVSSQNIEVAGSRKTTPNDATAPGPTVVTTITVVAEALPVSLAPASASVVEEEQITSSRALTSADLMRTVPFVSLAQNGSAGSLSTVTIRGGKPNLVLVLIDGVPVNDLSNLLGGAFDFSSLLTHDVERVEVIRGPLSAGYGSEAMSGVINVITKPVHYEPDISVGVETGSFGAAGLNANAEGSLGHMGYKVSGAFLRVGDQVESDPVSMSTFSAASDYTRNAASTMSWTARWIQLDRSGFPENGGGPEFSVLRIPKTSNSGDFLASFLFKHQFSEVWSAGIGADVFTRGERSYTPAILDSPHPSSMSQPSTFTHTRFNRPRIRLQNVFNFAPQWQGHFVVQGADEIGDNSTLISNLYDSRFNTNRGVVNAGGDLVYSSDRMSAMAALGLNKTSGFDLQIAPRVGAALQVAKNTIVKASWGRAYKVPSLYALGNPNVGNPGLRPERVTGLDAGVQQRLFPKLTLSGTYYYNLFSNLIDFSADVFRLVNRTRVRTEGVEAEATLSVDRGIQLKAWGGFLNWKIESSSEPLRDQPDWQAGFSGSARLRKKFQVSTATVWVGRRYDFQVPVSAIQTTGGYSTTNLVVGYDGFRHMDLFARIDNLLSHRFHEYLGFPSPGISAQIAIIYHPRRF